MLTNKEAQALKLTYAKKIKGLQAKNSEFTARITQVGVNGGGFRLYITVIFKDSECFDIAKVLEAFSTEITAILNGVFRATNIKDSNLETRKNEANGNVKVTLQARLYILDYVVK